jgi:SAM-dependent methyltransferase
VATLYDDIGRTYSGRRQSDPRIAAAIDGALSGCESILNVGAGTGSYEQQSGRVVAIEPSRTMIMQRPADAAPVVQGCAESLPFRDGSFDAVLGIMTVHHWTDQTKGLAECARVARRRVVLLTNDFDVCATFWLFDYIPELLSADRHLFPSIRAYKDLLGPIDIIPVPVPYDCRDGFLGAYWQRPSAYLDPLVRAGISAFSKVGPMEFQLARLAGEIASGAWADRHRSLLGLDALDLGYRLVVARRDVKD